MTVFPRVCIGAGGYRLDGLLQMARGRSRVSKLCGRPLTLFDYVVRHAAATRPHALDQLEGVLLPACTHGSAYPTDRLRADLLELGVPSRGRWNHLHAPLYFSVVVIHTTQTGWSENECTARG